MVTFECGQQVLWRGALQHDWTILVFSRVQKLTHKFSVQLLVFLRMRLPTPSLTRQKPKSKFPGVLAKKRSLVRHSACQQGFEMAHVDFRRVEKVGKRLEFREEVYRQVMSGERREGLQIIFIAFIHIIIRMQSSFFVWPS